MKMTDILSTEEWQALDAEIAEKFGLNPSIQDAEGGLVVGGDRFGNALCARIRKDPKGVGAICAVAGQFFSSELRTSMEPLVDECDAGLSKIAVPVVVDGEMIGSVGCCGAVLDDGEADDFMVARSLGVDEEELAPLMENMPKLTSEEAADIQAWLTAKVESILAGLK